MGLRQIGTVEAALEWALAHLSDEQRSRIESGETTFEELIAADIKAIEEAKDKTRRLSAKEIRELRLQVCKMKGTGAYIKLRDYQLTILLDYYERTGGGKCE